jgi:ribonuclease G
MQKQIVVNVGARETRVAILEEGRLVELKVEREDRIVGNVYKGRVENVVPGLDAAFVNIGLDRNAFLYVAEAMPEEPPFRNGRPQGLPPITNVLKHGQELLVQVTKGPIGRKGARVTARLSLPGRYAVLSAQGAKKVGVSRKIESREERDRLRKIGEAARPRDSGLIIRTQAEGVSSTRVERDVRFLRRLWRTIRDKAKKVDAPALVHDELGLAYIALRDLFSPDVEEFVVDDDEVYQRLESLAGMLTPRLRDRIIRYDDDQPIFERYGVESEIEAATRPRVWLPHGGSIVIQEAEALTAIDVNTGKFTGTDSLASTVLQTNLEAVEEIGRQLRLRDIGGILVIDFIDMDNAKHRRSVMSALRETLKRDRMKTRIIHLTPLGLVEMTRKRTGESLRDITHVACPTCEGRGRILSPESVAIHVERQLKRLARRSKAEAFMVTVHPSVMPALIGENGEGAEGMEQRIGRPVYVRSAQESHPERIKVEGGDIATIERKALPHKHGAHVQIRSDQIVPGVPDRSLAVVDGYAVEVPDGIPGGPGPVEVELTEVHHAFARAKPVKAARPSRRSRR